MLLGRGVSPVIAGALTLVVVVAFALLAPASQKGVGPRLADAAPAAPAVEVRVDCASNPELTAITNNTHKSFTVEKVGSMYEPRSDEPFVAGGELAPGVTGVVESGPKADANVLTNKFIYDDNVGSEEGAWVATSVGEFTESCAEPTEKNGTSAETSGTSTTSLVTPESPPAPSP